jgi:vacuolar-type H+-ATPase subunit E/Vma4
MVLRRIFLSKKDEIIGGWRKLHNEELRNLYSSSEYYYFGPNDRASPYLRDSCTDTSLGVTE